MGLKIILKLKLKLLMYTKKNNKNLYIRLLNLNENQNYDGGIYELQFANGNFLSWTHGDLQHLLLMYFIIQKIKNKKKFLGKDLEQTIEDTTQ